MKTKVQISFAVTANLIRAFDFATPTAKFLYFLNPKFPVSSHLLCLYSFICVQPDWRPHCWFSHVVAHLLGHAQRAHDVRMTSDRRRCNVMTSHRRRSDVMCQLGGISPRTFPICRHSACHGNMWVIPRLLYCFNTGSGRPQDDRHRSSPPDPEIHIVKINQWS